MRKGKMRTAESDRGVWHSLVFSKGLLYRRCNRAIGNVKISKVVVEGHAPTCDRCLALLKGITEKKFEPKKIRRKASQSCTTICEENARDICA